MGDAADEGESRVENRQTQNQEGHHEGDDRIVLEQALDGHGGQNEAQEGGSGVAHEHLGGVEVIGHEAHAGAHQRGHDHGHFLIDHQGDDQHGGGGDGGDAVGKAVQSVDQVDGVGDGHDPDDRKGHGQAAQYPVEAVRENVGVGESQNGDAVGGGDGGGHNLDDEFQHGGQGHDIVHNAQHHDDNGAQQDALHLRRDGNKQQDAHHEADANGQTAQTGDRFLVHAAVVLGDIDRTDLICQHTHDRCDGQGDQPCTDQTEKDLKIH